MELAALSKETDTMALVSLQEAAALPGWFLEGRWARDGGFLVG